MHQTVFDGHSCHMGMYTYDICMYVAMYMHVCSKIYMYVCICSLKLHTLCILYITLVGLCVGVKISTL